MFLLLHYPTFLHLNFRRSTTFRNQLGSRTFRLATNFPVTNHSSDLGSRRYSATKIFNFTTFVVCTGPSVTLCKAAESSDGGNDRSWTPADRTMSATTTAGTGGKPVHTPILDDPQRPRKLSGRVTWQRPRPRPWPRHHDYRRPFSKHGNNRTRKPIIGAGCSQQWLEGSGAPRERERNRHRRGLKIESKQTFRACTHTHWLVNFTRRRLIHPPLYLPLPSIFDAPSGNHRYNPTASIVQAGFTVAFVALASFSNHVQPIVCHWVINIIFAEMKFRRPRFLRRSGNGGNFWKGNMLPDLWIILFLTLESKRISFRDIKKWKWHVLRKIIEIDKTTLELRFMYVDKISNCERNYTLVVPTILIVLCNVKVL